MSEVWIIFIQINKKDPKKSKFLFMNCAGWNPIKLYKYKQYPYKKSKWKSEIEWNWNIDGKNESLQIVSFKELSSFLISPGLNHFGINLWKCKNKTKALYFNTVNWLHSDTSITMYTYRERYPSSNGRNTSQIKPVDHWRNTVWCYLEELFFRRTEFCISVRFVSPSLQDIFS